MAAYPAYPLPTDEPQRLRDLERFGLADLSNDVHFQRIVGLARTLFHVPIAAISLVEADRQWFLASAGLEVSETPRSMAFCAHAIAGEDVFVVPDARGDERFAGNPLVLGPPHIRFYAGAPLRSPDGHNLGTLCVIDREPQRPDPLQLLQLQWLAELVMRELELRRHSHLCPVTGLPTRPAFFAIGAREFQRARAEGHPLALLLFDIDNFRQINLRWGHAAGDEVLADLSRLGASFLREEDYAARVSDEEFALLLVGVEPDAAMGVAESLRHAVTHMGGVFRHSDYHLCISGGLTCLAAADRHFADMVTRAERALQLAKGNGRNQIASLLAEP